MGEQKEVDNHGFAVPQEHAPGFVYVGKIRGRSVKVKVDDIQNVKIASLNLDLKFLGVKSVDELEIVRKEKI
ncbi:MAG: hypothetical protein E2O29_01510 [Deltaproteobacteria bacterium]|nr:MAG: hypothetical protein E2O29_01510 [Deltaproteobacteria bacterium]